MAQPQKTTHDVGSAEPSKSDLAKLADPNFVLELAVGPPFPELVPQKKGDGIQFAGKYSDKPQRFIFKEAHFSTDDYRIWDDRGKLVYNAFHPGKDPYGSLDPLGLTNHGDKYTHQYGNGEWEFHCDVRGHQGFPSFEIRPKTFSKHGYQYVRKPKDSGDVLAVGNMSRIKTQSIRHGIAVGKGKETSPSFYHSAADMIERTMQIFNEKDELVCFIQKSLQTLVLNVELGTGTELLIDIAPGVDASTMLAICLAMKQIGKHAVKDAFDNYVVEEAQEKVLDAFVEATGPAGESLVKFGSKITHELIGSAEHANSKKTHFKRMRDFFR